MLYYIMLQFQTSKNTLNDSCRVLSKGGQAAAWIVAFGVVGAWQYYEMNRKNAEVFTKAEQEKWNEERKHKK